MMRMRIFKFTVIRLYEKFYSNVSNNRYFFEDIFNAYCIALVYLNKEHNYSIDRKYIKLLNEKWKEYHSDKLFEAIEYYNKDTTDYEKKVSEKYNYLKQEIKMFFFREVENGEIGKVLNLFFEKTKHIIDVEDDINYEVDEEGVIAVDSRYWS